MNVQRRYGRRRVARWDGRCHRCAEPIAAGEPVDTWPPLAGATSTVLTHPACTIGAGDTRSPRCGVHLERLIIPRDVWRNGKFRPSPTPPWCPTCGREGRAGGAG